MSKIFHLIDSIQLGGAEIVAFNITEFCKLKCPDTFEFVIVELHQSHDDYSFEKRKELMMKKIRLISLSKWSKRISLAIGPVILAYHLLKEKPDIIHSHTDLPDIVLSTTLRLFTFFHIKAPKIVRTIHNTDLWTIHPKWGKYTESAFVNDNVVGVSMNALEAYRNLRKKNNLPVSDKQQLIYNGCAIPQKRPHPFLIDNKKINVAFCGRFEIQKGIDILIERIKSINNRFFDDFLFHIIGNGTFYDDVFWLAKENSNVLVYEPVPNISDKLYAFDFLIMPSRFEGLVLVSMEASFSRVPVIAAYAPGLSETLPTNWPFQFQLENEKELMILFEKIKNNEYDLSALKNKAFSYVSEKFSHKKMIDAYSKLYFEIYE